jgi:tetratricopeptide (TPR) repeat protein
MHREEIPLTHLTEEEDLLSDSYRLFRRALDLATRTSSIKVWVPVLCSCILTGYYLYGLHRKSQNPAFVVEMAEPGAKAVPEPLPNAASKGNSSGDSQPASAEPDSDDDYSDIPKEAQQAHGSLQYAEEAKLWQRFMEHSASPQQACPAIGKAYELSGDLGGAVEAYKKCASLEPNNADILIPFAHALQAKSDFARATELYRQSLSIDPRNMDARTGLALIQLKLNHLDEADKAANDVLRTAPDNTDALLIAGIVAWRKGNLHDAEQVFLKGVGLDSQREDFHAFLGRIAEAERQPQLALRHYDKALALDPNDADVAERRDRLQVAK